MSTKLNGSKYCYVSLTSQLNISHLFIQLNQTVLFDPGLSLRARVDLGAMAMKGYSTFPKAPALLEPNHQIV